MGFLVEGRWGRRVWGSVTVDGPHTVFYLEIRMEPTLYLCRIRILNSDLEYCPGLYGIVLHDMTDELERALGKKNTP